MEVSILPFGTARPHIAESAIVMPTAVVIGDVEIGHEASVWYGCILRGDVNRISVGARSNLQDGTVVHVSPGVWPTLVGDEVLVGHSAMLHGCTLEDRSYVGMRATLLNGVVVESESLVAAGAVVAEGTRIRSGELWGGVPARKLREARTSELSDMAAAVVSYVELARQHRDEHLRAPRGASERTAALSAEPVHGGSRVPRT